MWDHYVAFSELPGRYGRIFANKVEHGGRLVGSSLHTSHSLDILEILTGYTFGQMVGYIMYICKISIFARWDVRSGRLMWLTKLGIDS